MAKKVSPLCRVCKCPLQLLRDPERNRMERRDTCVRCSEAGGRVVMRAKAPAREYVNAPSTPARPRLRIVPPLGRDEGEQERVQALAQTIAERLKGSRP